jgi:hypothetical protein
MLSSICEILFDLIELIIDLKHMKNTTAVKIKVKIIFMNIFFN